MRNTRFLFLKIAVLAFSVFCFVTLVSLQLQNNHLNDTAQIDEYEAYIDSLQATLDAPMDEEYVAEIAREKLGLRYPQEVIFYSDDSD